jgi:hypothetical protein
MNKVIKPIKIELTQSNKLLVISWNIVKPMTKASMLTDIPSIMHVLFFISISFSFSLIPSIIISIPTIPIIIPPAMEGIVAI